MTDTTFSESDHPRAVSGEFATKEQTPPDIGAFTKSESDALVESLNARRQALYATYRAINIDLAKLGAKQLAVEILAEFPNATTVTLEPSDQSDSWWVNEIRAADDEVLGENEGEFFGDDIPLEKPQIVHQMSDGRVETVDDPAFDWLTIDEGTRTSYGVGTIDLRKAAAIEV